MVGNPRATAKALATAPVPRTAAATIVRTYPVTRERAATADIESTARKIAAMGRMIQWPARKRHDQPTPRAPAGGPAKRSDERRTALAPRSPTLLAGRAARAGSGGRGERPRGVAVRGRELSVRPSDRAPRTADISPPAVCRRPILSEKRVSGSAKLLSAHTRYSREAGGSDRTLRDSW